MIQVPIEEVRQHIQEADWLIFAALDLNLSRFSDSDALKLFLAQESGALLDKTTVVLAFNAPYYLDTTEVTKLTAYYGIYSKTTPHIEAAVRALFGEIGLPSPSPVSVEGIGYELVDALAPNPDQDLIIETVNISPTNRTPPVSVTVRVGPVLDRNNRRVPDETPIEINAKVGERELIAETAYSTNGLAEATLILKEPGEIEVFAATGQNLVSEVIKISVQALTTPTTSPTASPTPAPALPTETATAAPTTTPQPTDTPTPTPMLEPVIPAVDPPPSIAEPTQATPEPRALDSVDLISALGATLLAGLVGFWLGQQLHSPLSRRVRMGLWVLIGGLTAYLLYGAGWLRPEQWLLEKPDLLAGRLSVAGLAFMFGAIALGLSTNRFSVKKR